MMSLSGRLLSEKLDVLRLSFYMSPLIVVSLAPFYARMEADALDLYRHEVGSHGYIGTQAPMSIC
jgi:hypothetical protein